jgi:hypothetical protein
VIRTITNITVVVIIAVLASCGRPDEKHMVGDQELNKILAVLPAGASGISVVKGTLDGDPDEEFAVSYEDSIRGTVFAIMDATYITRFEFSSATDQAAAVRLVDVDGDSILEVVLTGPASGGECIQIVRCGDDVYSIVADFWGLRVKLFDEDNDGRMEIEVENRDFDRNPDRHTIHTFYRWDGVGFSPFRSYKASQRFNF